MTETSATVRRPLAPGERFDLVISLRDALDKMDGHDAYLLMREFGVPQPHDDDLNPPTRGELLQDTDDDKLIGLGEYLHVPAASSGEDDKAPDLGDVDAYTELVAAETTLRDVIRLVIPRAPAKSYSCMSGGMK
ncbi:hypothetical protein ACFWDA_25635 [Rhodococcus zopfii]|uniref:hypothetical protein n=1 Tax=Rhodococcus zopfii TaxID=43772 RepID=UPI003528DE74